MNNIKIKMKTCLQLQVQQVPQQETVTGVKLALLTKMPKGKRSVEARAALRIQKFWRLAGPISTAKLIEGYLLHGPRIEMIKAKRSVPRHSNAGHWSFVSVLTVSLDWCLVFKVIQ